MGLFSNFPQSPDAEIKAKIKDLEDRVQTVGKGGTGATTAAQALANLGGVAAGAVGNLYLWRRSTVAYKTQPAATYFEYTTDPFDITVCDDVISVDGTLVGVNPKNVYIGDETSAKSVDGMYWDGTEYDSGFAKLEFLSFTSADGATFRAFSIHATTDAIPYQTVDYPTAQSSSLYPTDGVLSNDQGNYYYQYLGKIGMPEYLGDLHVFKKSAYSVDFIGLKTGISSYSPSSSVKVSSSINIDIENRTVSLVDPSDKTFSDLNPGDYYIEYASILYAESVNQYGASTSVIKKDVSEIFDYPSVHFLTTLDRYGYQEGVRSEGNTAVDITYLGQLGDRARIEVGSYVGTGTYGSSNPNSLTFGFEPKMVIISTGNVNSFSPYGFLRGDGYFNVVLSSQSTDTGVTNEISWDGKTVSWYASSYYGGGTGGLSAYGANGQLNTSGKTYNYIAIG